MPRKYSGKVFKRRPKPTKAQRKRRKAWSERTGKPLGEYAKAMAETQGPKKRKPLGRPSKAVDKFAKRRLPASIGRKVKFTSPANFERDFRKWRKGKPVKGR